MKTKNLILTLAIALISTGAFAQTTEPNLPQVPTEQKTQQKDVYLMQEGKMWWVKDTEKIEMAEDVTLQNGTLIKTDGSVIKSDGEKVQLKNGQYIDRQGNISEWVDQQTIQ